MAEEMQRTDHGVSQEPERGTREARLKSPPFKGQAPSDLKTCPWPHLLAAVIRSNLHPNPWTVSTDSLTVNIRLI